MDAQDAVEGEEDRDRFKVIEMFEVPRVETCQRLLHHHVQKERGQLGGGL